MKYRVHSISGPLTVEVPGEKREDRIRIPLTIYKACWLDRLFNLNIEVFRFDEGIAEQLIFNWPACKMNKPEVVVDN